MTCAYNQVGRTLWEYYWALAKQPTKKHEERAWQLVHIYNRLYNIVRFSNCRNQSIRLAYMPLLFIREFPNFQCVLHTFLVKCTLSTTRNRTVATVVKV